MAAPSTETTTAPRPPVREVRLGLVLNGGVSLAIWIGGVVRELDNLRRASDEQTFRELEGTAALYRDLLRTLQEKVVVDVVAGASAGGINGIVLTGAIFAGKPLPDLRETWIGLGDARTLMRSPSEPNPPSLMRGDDVVLGELRDVLDVLMEGADGQRCNQSHLYLYVTSTDLFGFVRSFHDSTGRKFEELDYRRVFDFRHVRGDAARGVPENRLDVMRKPVFFRDPDAGRLLARAARATSSFPVVFEPHRLRILARSRPPLGPDAETGANGDDDRPLELRADWHWLLDGGVLDNQPFNPVLDRIAVLPPSELPTRRVVAYVVPYVNEPGSVEPEVPEKPGAMASYGASGSLPRTLTKLQSLDRVTAEWMAQQIARDDMQRLWITLQGERLEAAARELFGAYAQTRAAAAARLFGQWADPLFQDGEGVYAQDPAIDPNAMTTRPTAGSEAIDDRASEPWLPDAPDWSESDSTWSWGLAPAERAAGWALISVRELRETRPRPSAEALAAVGDAVRLAGSLVPDCRAEKEVLLEAFRNAAGTDPLERARTAYVSCVTFLTELQRRFVELDRAIATLNDNLPIAQRVPGVRSLLHLEVVQNALKIEDSRAPFPFDFLFMSAGCENSLGHAARTPQEKLAGIKLNHFAGFLKRSWRANDWLWGRLDGVEHSLRAILDLDLLLHVDVAEVAPELARLAFPPGTGAAAQPAELAEAWELGLGRDAEANRKADPPTPLLASTEKTGDPRAEFVTLLGKAADPERPNDYRERCLRQCRVALAARIQTAVLDEDLDRVAETAAEDADMGASKLVSGYHWASRFFRRDGQLRRAGMRPLDTTERVRFFKELAIGEESPKDEASSRLTIGLAAQGAAVATAMAAGDRSGLPTSVRTMLATVRAFTLAVTSVVRLVAQSPAVGAAVVFSLAAVLVWATVNPGVLLGSLVPALAGAVVVGGAAIFTIVTSVLEKPIRSVGMAVAYAAMLGVPLAFALLFGFPACDHWQDWLQDHVEENAVLVAAALAALAAAAAIARGVLEVLIYVPKERKRPLSWIRKALNAYRVLALLTLTSLAVGFVITRWRGDHDPQPGCPTTGCRGFNWDNAADERAGTILLLVLLVVFLFAAVWIEVLLPLFQRRRLAKRQGS